MNVRPVVFAATLLALTSTPALAQRGGPGGRGGAMAMQNPVSYLLDHGDQLKLTDDQKVSLQVVADSLDTLNAPDLKKFEDARASGDRSAFQSLRTVMQAVRERNDTYVEKAKALLTDEQKPIADELLAEIAPRGRRGGGGVR